MSVLSIVLAALSLLCIPLGVVLAPVPVVGAVFAFGAAALALAGIITGGLAMSRGKRAGQATGVAQAGVISSALAFVPALLTALTCGVCNALFAGGHFEASRDFHVSVQQGLMPPAADGGAPGGSGGARAAPDQPAAPRPPGAPPPAFPPPPLKP